tara:strand:+ start:1567 stop:2403 length:837 start_codon:yes stop_codon:yes gene_type:complete
VLNLVTVVGRNTHILPHMLKHYESKVDNSYVVVYRQDDKDGILEEIEELGITPHLIVTEPKYHWERVTDLYNKVKAERPKDWWIVSDDDELQVYPEPLDDIIKHCENNKYEFVTGGFLDRIGTDGSFPKVDRDTNLHQAFPLAGFFRYPLSGACPNKVTLMKGSQKVTPGQHYAKFKEGNSWGTSHPKRMPVQECFTQVHHFKWDSTVLERLLEVAETKKKYSYYAEYNKMYRAIARNNWKIDINNKDFLVEKLKNISYLRYNDYSKWVELTKTIIKI